MIFAATYCLITSGSAATGAATTSIDRGSRPNSRASLSSMARPHPAIAIRQIGQENLTLPRNSAHSELGVPPKGS
jgi:hypothetical protein